MTAPSTPRSSLGEAVKAALSVLDSDVVERRVEGVRRAAERPAT